MKYTTAAAVKMPAGSVLGLTEVQAVARRHCVRALDGQAGWYTATDEVHLKAGEPLELRGTLSRALQAVLNIVPASSLVAASVRTRQRTAPATARAQG